MAQAIDVIREYNDQVAELEEGIYYHADIHKLETETMKVLLSQFEIMQFWKDFIRRYLYRMSNGVQIITDFDSLIYIYSITKGRKEK